VTSAEILQELGLPPVRSTQQAREQWRQLKPAFMPIEVLAPRLSDMLGLRRILGVRNSTHTLVKILQPFAQPALRLVSYTHPEYLEMLSAYFSDAAPSARGEVFLMRGTEGETVANARRAQQIQWFHQGQRTILVERQEPVDEMPPLPAASDAATTAAWIRAALDGTAPVPEPIACQVEHCLKVAGELRAHPA
jgi:anthranilate phosphoribosyltransferase